MPKLLGIEHSKGVTATEGCPIVRTITVRTSEYCRNQTHVSCRNSLNVHEKKDKHLSAVGQAKTIQNRFYSDGSLRYVPPAMTGLLWGGLSRGQEEISRLVYRLKTRTALLTFDDALCLRKDRWYLNIMIQKSRCPKDLGPIFSPDLSWKPQAPTPPPNSLSTPHLGAFTSSSAQVAWGLGVGLQHRSCLETFLMMFMMLEHCGMVFVTWSDLGISWNEKTFQLYIYIYNRMLAIVLAKCGL